MRGWTPFAPVMEGRQRAELDHDHCLFLVGYRLNRLWRVDQGLLFVVWLERMLRELQRHGEEIGFLGHQRAYAFGTGPMSIQHWRSFEDLEAYGRAAARQHVPGWTVYNKRLRPTGAVGVWHETYVVSAQDREAVYVNMPRVGLGRAGTLRPLGSTSTAAERMGRLDETGAPVGA